MDTWIKRFSDGSKEVGTDKLIKEGKASWTKGKQNNIISVSLSFEKTILTLDCGLDSHAFSEWYQFDRYLVSSGKTERQFRVLQRLISPTQVGKEIKQTTMVYDGINLLGLSIEEPCEPNSKWYKIKPSDVGKWLTLSIERECFKMLFSKKGTYVGKNIK